jgi:hypothetical protein
VRRSIRTLHNFDPPATADEMHGAGFAVRPQSSTRPSPVNAEAFAGAGAAVEDAALRVLDELVATAPLKNREVEVAKARERAALRYGAG